MIQVDQFVADNHVEWTLAPVAAPTNAAAPADLATVKPQKQDIEKELARVLRYFYDRYAKNPDCDIFSKPLFLGRAMQARKTSQ